MGTFAAGGRRFVVACLAIVIVSLGALAFASAAADGYPSRPVKIIVPFAPGGPTEFIIRLVADRLTAALGQPFVIENRPGGAGGTVGAKSVATADADGYTLLFSSPGPLVTAAAVYKNLDYDPIKSFAPIAMLIYAPQMVVVHPALPVKSFAELVAYAKDNPGKITFGSSGYGTQPHMLGEMLKREAGINIIHIPYRGAGQSVSDVVAGQTQMIRHASEVPVVGEAHDRPEEQLMRENRRGRDEERRSPPPLSTDFAHARVYPRTRARGKLRSMPSSTPIGSYPRSRRASALSGAASCSMRVIA